MANNLGFSFSRLFRPIILKRQKAVLISELFDILARSEQLALPLPEVLASVQREYRDPVYKGLLKYLIFVGILGVLLLFAGLFGNPFDLYNSGIDWGGFIAYLIIMTCLYILFTSQQGYTGYVSMLARRLHRPILQGFSLSQAMERNRDWFDTYQIETILAGEKAGKLQMALHDLSRFERSRISTIDMTRFMIYPFYLGGTYAIIVAFLCVYVLPKYQGILHDLGGQLPEITTMLISVSAFITHNALIVIVIIASFVLGLAYILIFPFSGSNNAIFYYCMLLLGTSDAFIPLYFESLPKLTAFFPEYKLPITIVMTLCFCIVQIVLPLGFLILIRMIIEKGFSSILALLQFIPFCSRLFRAQALARFFTSLGMLIEAKCPVSDSLVTAARCSGSKKMIQIASHAQKRIEQGQSLSEALESVSWIPLKVRRTIHLSEENETLPAQCLDLAQYLQVEFDNRSQRIGAILEPFSIVCIGLFAFFVVASFYLPIFYIPKVLLQHLD